MGSVSLVIQVVPPVLDINTTNAIVAMRTHQERATIFIIILAVKHALMAIIRMILIMIANPAIQYAQSATHTIIVLNALRVHIN